MVAVQIPNANVLITGDIFRRIGHVLPGIVQKLESENRQPQLLSNLVTNPYK